MYVCVCAINKHMNRQIGFHMYCTRINIYTHLYIHTHTLLASKVPRHRTGLQPTSSAPEWAALGILGFRCRSVWLANFLTKDQHQKHKNSYWIPDLLSAVSGCVLGALSACIAFLYVLALWSCALGPNLNRAIGLESAAQGPVLGRLFQRFQICTARH